MSSALAPLQGITRNLPAFIRDPLIAVIGKECYTSLIWNIDVSDTACIKYSVSKGLGLGLVVGGGIVKVPQIIKILQSHSARGLSLTSYLLDTASLLIIVAYNARLHFPFSTYGENAFLSIQNVVIVLLIIAYSRGSSAKAAKALTFLAGIGGASYALSSDALVPIPLLRTLLAASIPLSLSSKVPQIYKIFKSKTTGQLSAFLVFNSLLGCLARVFTTATETGDVTLWWSFVSASILNGIIALQMFYYWNSSDSKISQKGERVASLISDKVQEKKKRDEAAPVSSALPAKMPVGTTPAKPVQLQQQSQPDVLSPTRSGLRSAGRAPSARYTRKVD